MRNNENKSTKDPIRRYMVTAKIDGKIFTNISFGVENLARYWFNQWQQSYRSWAGTYTIELYLDNKKIDSAAYEGTGELEIKPEPLKPHKKKPFVPQVFPDFEKPHYNCIVGTGKMSEKEIYKEDKPEKKPAKRTRKTKKEDKKPVKRTTRKTSKTAKTVKKTTKK